MTFETALRLTEALLALAFLQQSAEHLRRFPDERLLFALRGILCALLLVNIAPPYPLIGLAAVSLATLRRFQGPYNGGSDRMGLLALWCVMLTHLLPSEKARELAFGYLGAQLVLSYFIAGWVKIVNPEWRSGAALRQVFAFSVYPVSESVRAWAKRPALMQRMSWAVMLLELMFPLAFFSKPALIVGLSLTALFHLANACLFGLNRFFWTWIAAYPAIIWLQTRIA